MTLNNAPKSGPFALPVPPTTPPEGYVFDAKGRMVPASAVRPPEALEDQTVRIALGYAVALANQIHRFFSHTMADFEGFMMTLEEQYGVTKKGAKGKGNVSLTSYDGLMRVQFAVADRITFGPELQVAKTLFDECVCEWAEGSRPEMRVLIDDAFRVDKTGMVNRESVFRLLRLSFEDSRWRRAQDAIKDSIRIEGSKRYVRFYVRPSVECPWQAVPIDIASVGRVGQPETQAEETGDE